MCVWNFADVIVLPTETCVLKNTNMCVCGGLFVLALTANGTNASDPGGVVPNVGCHWSMHANETWCWTVQSLPICPCCAVLFKLPAGSMQLHWQLCVHLCMG
jgi:hypothetical protein